MKISISKEISKLAVSVFPWIEEPEKAMKWQQNIKESEILQDKPEVVGTTFKETVEENGKSLEMYGTITKYVKDKLIGFHLKSRIHEVDVCYYLDEFDGGTKVLVEASINWKFPMNIVRLLIGKKIKKGIVNQLESELHELKELCEIN
jgi:hypothetical protein